MNNDLISREQVLHEIGKLSLDWEYGQGVKDCFNIVDNAPTVKPCENCDLYFKAMTKQEEKKNED